MERIDTVYTRLKIRLGPIMMIYGMFSQCLALISVWTTDDLNGFFNKLSDSNTIQNKYLIDGNN